MNLFRPFILCVMACLASACASAQSVRDVEDIFEDNYRNGLVMQVEAAITGAQADLGIVPEAAAEEIAAKASVDHAPLEDIEAEYDIVRHRMVALLNVWRRDLSEEAGNALHLGVTTVDIYDTVLVLQILEAIDLMEAEMLALEQDMICLAETYRDTPMMGRTLGQHALPITFGKKVAVWAAQVQRNIERLEDVRSRLRSSGVLKGAVGTHLGLGAQGWDIEQGVSARLGLDPPEPADWRPARDTFAEYAQTLALVAKSHAAIGGEVYRLQMTDIGEVYEERPSTAVGSSTMPHKRNPSLSEALIFHGRTIPALADIVLADVEAVFERDNTSRPNRVLEEITVESADMISSTRRLVGRLHVNSDRMRLNMDRTDGMIMSQRVMLFLAEGMSREVAEEHVRAAAMRSLETGVSFQAALLEDEVIGERLAGHIEGLLDPTADLGLAAAQVDRTRSWIVQRRNELGLPALASCSGVNPP